MSDNQLKMMSFIIWKMKLSSITLVICPVELNVLKQAEVKKTKNDQSYLFYIHIKIVVFVGIGFLFSLEKKQMEKLNKSNYLSGIEIIYICCAATDPS